MKQTTEFETAQLTKPEATGLTKAIEVVIQQIQPHYKQLEIAHKIVERAGDRNVPRSIKVDARAFAELEAALTELKRWKAKLETGVDDASTDN